MLLHAVWIIALLRVLHNWNYGFCLMRYVITDAWRSISKFSLDTWKFNHASTFNLRALNFFSNCVLQQYSFAQNNIHFYIKYNNYVLYSIVMYYKLTHNICFCYVFHLFYNFEYVEKIWLMEIVFPIFSMPIMNFVVKNIYWFETISIYAHLTALKHYHWIHPTFLCDSLIDMVLYPFIYLLSRSVKVQ